MNSGSVLCPGCRLPLPAAAFSTANLTACPACQRRILVEVFPAVFRTLTAANPAEPVLEEGVSSCFYHDQKKAVVPCDSCGRFLCSLCDVDFNGRHLCPNCLQTGQTKGKIVTLETQRILWDSAALSLTLLPLVAWPMTLLTAPLAFGCAIYSFFRPSSLVPRTRFRAYAAILLSLAQIAGWVLIFTGASGWFEHVNGAPG